MTAFVKLQHFLRLHAELHEQKLLCCAPVLIPVAWSRAPLYVSVSRPLVEYWRLFSTPTWLTGTPSSSSQPAIPAPHFVTFEQMFTCRLMRKRKWSELHLKENDEHPRAPSSPETLFRLQLSDIHFRRPTAEGWTQSPCLDPPLHSPGTQGINFWVNVPQSELNPGQEENIGEKLTWLLVVATAQAALVSHIKEAVQFWYIMKCGFLDCTHSVRNARE